MARLKELAIGRGGDSFIFDPEMIEEKEGYNVRDMNSPETVAHIRKMADAIHAGGTAAFPPITIHQEDGRIYVVAGYCRRRAFILAKQEGAPIKGILAVANTQNEADRTLDLLNSNDGLPLTMMEQANAVQRLISFQWTPQEIAKRRGVSVTAIQNLLSLLEVPAEVKDLVTSGKVSATLAVKTVKEKGPEAADTLKTAVKNAEEKGKPKATAKHMPVKAESVPIEKLDEALNLLPGTCAIEWGIWGPRCKKYLEKFRDAETVAELQQMQVDLRHFLAGVGK